MSNIIRYQPQNIEVLSHGELLNQGAIDLLSEVAPETARELKDILFQVQALQSVAPAVHAEAEALGKILLTGAARGERSGEGEFTLIVRGNASDGGWFFPSTDEHNIEIRGSMRFRFGR